MASYYGSLTIGLLKPQQPPTRMNYSGVNKITAKFGGKNHVAEYS
jgi:hypothetical protein